MQIALTRSDESLAQAIRRHRLAAGYTLRGFAKVIDISPTYQSDIENSRRLPTDDVLRKTADVLGRRVTVSYNDLRDLCARIEPDLRDLVKDTPEVNQLLRQVQRTGRPAREVVKQLQRELRRIEAEADKPRASSHKST